jgi:hypothetical protein
MCTPGGAGFEGLSELTFIFYFKIHDDQLNYEYTPYSNPSKYFTHSSTKGIKTIKYLSIKLYTSLYSNSKALPAWGYILSPLMLQNLQPGSVWYLHILCNRFSQGTFVSACCIPLKPVHIYLRYMSAGRQYCHQQYIQPNNSQNNVCINSCKQW